MVYYLPFFFFFLFLIFYFFLTLIKKDGETPLFIAAQEGYKQIVQILLEKGKANVNFANKVNFLFLILFLKKYC